MRQPARCLVQTRASSGPWRTAESTHDRALAQSRADALAAATLDFGPSPTAPKYFTYPGVRVVQAGQTIYDPRSTRR